MVSKIYLFIYFLFCAHVKKAYSIYLNITDWHEKYVIKIV
jgi:hypothetical protein